MSVVKPGAVIWVTGASSGIGEALARRFAAEGAKVAISARSADRLAGIAASSDLLFAYPLDVTDADATADAAARITRDLGAIDLAILNAGVWHPMGARDYDRAKVAQSMMVNYIGVINALDPVMHDMIGRGRGHIAVVSSVAGYRGLPKSVAYGPTKAALINMCEALYADLKSKGVKLQVINPGFVETPMTDVNTFPMPFKVSVDDAVSRIAAGLEKRGFEIVFPWPMAIIMKLIRLLPYRVFFLLTGRI